MVKMLVTASVDDAGLEEMRTKRAAECMVDVECPPDCRCEGPLVNCSARRFESVPAQFPNFATEMYFVSFHVFTYFVLSHLFQVLLQDDIYCNLCSIYDFIYDLYSS